MERSLEASDQSDSFDVLWNTSDQSEYYKPVISDGLKRSTPFNTLNVGVFRSFISSRSARIAIIIIKIKKRQLWCVDEAGTRLHTSSDCDLLCVPTVKRVTFDSWTATATSLN